MTARIVVQLDHPHVVCDPRARAARLLDLTITTHARDRHRPRRPNRCRQFGAKHRLVLHKGDTPKLLCRRCGTAWDALHVTIERPPLNLPEVTFG